MPQNKEATERIMRGVENSNLPPSIEAAYYKKAIELKKRVVDIETNNDVKRQNLMRVNRDVQKLRMERALLIEMVRNGMAKVAPEEASEESDDSAPPSPPVNKPTRTKRSSKGKGRDGEDDEGDETMIPGTSPAPQDIEQDDGTRGRQGHAYSNGAATSEDVAMTDVIAPPVRMPVAGGFTAVNAPG